MRPIALLRTFFVLTLIVSIASALAAIVARGRMTSHGGPADDELDLVAIFRGMGLAHPPSPLRARRLLPAVAGFPVFRNVYKHQHLVKVVLLHIQDKMAYNFSCAEAEAAK